MSNIPQHPEWAFCGRCKYFDSYNPEIDFEKESDVTHFGRCDNPKWSGQIVAAVADCSMFERKEDSHE